MAKETKPTIAIKPTKETKPTKNKISEDLQELELEIEIHNPEIFEGVPIEKKEEILEFISFTSIKQTNHSGPLPDAESLVQYNDVIPNGADRIMIMAEKEQDHRVSLQSKMVNDQNSESKLGQIFGFIIGLVGVGCGTYLAATGHEAVGGIIAGGTVVSLVTVFVVGKKLQEPSKEENKS